MNRKLMYIIAIILVILFIIAGVIYYFQNKNYGYCEEFEAGEEVILACDDEYIFESEIETDQIYVARNKQFKVTKNEYENQIKNSSKLYSATYDLDKEDKKEKKDKKSNKKSSKKGSSGKGS